MASITSLPYETEKKTLSEYNRDSSVKNQNPSGPIWTNLDQFCQLGFQFFTNESMIWSDKAFSSVSLGNGGNWGQSEKVCILSELFSKK